MLTQFGLRHISPILGGAISIPSATLLFWVLSPVTLGDAPWNTRGALIFAAVGLVFPATVTLLSFEANRRMGPNMAGTVGNLAPLFAVLFAVLMLGETLHPMQAVGIAAIVGGIMLLSAGGRAGTKAWATAALLLPLAAAAIRGAVQPAIKAGFMYWPDPMVAVLIGYTVSTVIATSVMLGRSDRDTRRDYNPRGIGWFASVGLCNGLAVVAMYSALGLGPVTLVSPLVATYPLVTLALSFLFLREEIPGRYLVGGVTATVLGVVLLIAA